MLLDFQRLLLSTKQKKYVYKFIRTECFYWFGPRRGLVGGLFDVFASGVCFLNLFGHLDVSLFFFGQTIFNYIIRCFS